MVWECWTCCWPSPYQQYLVCLCSQWVQRTSMCTHTHTHTHMYMLGHVNTGSTHKHTQQCFCTQIKLDFFSCSSLFHCCSLLLVTSLYLIPQSSLLIFSLFFSTGLSTNSSCLLCLWPAWQACWVKLGATWSPWPGLVGLVPVCQHDLRPCCQLSSYSGTPSYTVNRSRLSAATRTVILVLASNSVWCRRWDQTC